MQAVSIGSRFIEKGEQVTGYINISLRTVLTAQTIETVTGNYETVALL
jgi:hypothetical protein